MSIAFIPTHPSRPALAVQYGDVSSMTRSCFTLLASTTIGSGRGVIFGKRRLGDAQLSGTDFVRVLVPARRAAVVSMVRGSLPCRRKNPRFTPRNPNQVVTVLRYEDRRPRRSCSTTHRASFVQGAILPVMAAEPTYGLPPAHSGWSGSMPGCIQALGMSCPDGATGWGFKVDIRTNRHNAGWINVPMAHVVVPSDVH